MAAEVNGAINGTYGGHMNHLANDYGTAVAHSQPQQHHAVNGNGASAEPERSTKLPPGEIGWFFVEQYYNNLSTTPEKLHLFYNKRSQFTCGDEEEKTMVAMGQKAIEDRIAEMDFQDSKVRVTNVDVQESGKMILVQVIGEISLKAKPQRKFTQTFVLAEQPGGYFVLNDIMRFLLDEEPVSEVADNNGTVDEVPAPLAATLPEVPNEASKEDVAPVEAIDKKLEVLKSEENLQDLRADTPAVESAPEPVKAVETSVPPPAELESAQVETAAESLAPEAPTDPVPSPTATPQATELPATQAPTSAPAQPAAAPAPVPAKPATWAAMFANKTPTPVVPKVQNQAKPAKPATSNLAPANATAAQAPAQSAPVTSAPIPSSTPLQDDASVPASPGGWTNVTGHDHNRNRSRPANAQQNHVPENNNNVHGYIKNVTDRVNAVLLREALDARGSVAYFDVNRLKNCAFVEFPDQASFQAVVAGNPYMINGEEITVEERRTPAGNRNFRVGARGGRTGPDSNGRLNGQAQQGRGGFQGNNQGRGGHTARGGRGGQAQGQAQAGRPRPQQ